MCNRKTKKSRFIWIGISDHCKRNTEISEEEGNCKLDWDPRIMGVHALQTVSSLHMEHEFKESTSLDIFEGTLNWILKTWGGGYNASTHHSPSSLFHYHFLFMVRGMSNFWNWNEVVSQVVFCISSYLLFFFFDIYLSLLGGYFCHVESWKKGLCMVVACTLAGIEAVPMKKLFGPWWNSGIRVEARTKSIFKHWFHASVFFAEGKIQGDNVKSYNLHVPK